MISDNMHSHALFLLASVATTVLAACEREDLKELAIQYVDAQATGSVDELPPFIDVATVSIYPMHITTVKTLPRRRSLTALPFFILYED